MRRRKRDAGDNMLPNTGGRERDGGLAQPAPTVIDDRIEERDADSEDGAFNDNTALGVDAGGRLASGLGRAWAGGLRGRAIPTRQGDGAGGLRVLPRIRGHRTRTATPPRRRAPRAWEGGVGVRLPWYEDRVWGRPHPSLRP